MTPYLSTLLILLVALCALPHQSLSKPGKESGRSKRGIMDHVHTGTQYYRVKGRLKCGDAPAVGVKAKLVDIDFGPDPDDTLDEVYTDDQGTFDLHGDTFEGTNIDPHLKIYHDCNDGIRPCQRRWKFELPNKYINDRARTLDIGTWNLEAILPDEEHDCIH